MDFETSFEEFVEDKRFIALEVSDNDDDYDTDLTAETGDEVDSSVVPHTRSSKASLNTTGHSIPRKNTTNSKKRWSLLSNHSTVSSSKSKKRWSVLSSS